MSPRFAFLSPGALHVVSLKDGAWAREPLGPRGTRSWSAAAASLRRGFGRLRSGRPSQGQTREAAVASGVLWVSPCCSVRSRTVGEAGVGLGPVQRGLCGLGGRTLLTARSGHSP